VEWHRPASEVRIHTPFLDSTRLARRLVFCLRRSHPSVTRSSEQSRARSASCIAARGDRAGSLAPRCLGTPEAAARPPNCAIRIAIACMSSRAYQIIFNSHTSIGSSDSSTGRDIDAPRCVLWSRLPRRMPLEYHADVDGVSCGRICCLSTPLSAMTRAFKVEWNFSFSSIVWWSLHERYSVSRSPSLVVLSVFFSL
jgi:hypothetical protein